MQVAGYCRVSTDSAQQAESLGAQRRYFRDYISRQEGWELGEIYADEGFSGTSTHHREAFNRMMRDARAGKFQLILTKEVSRFSRNILDTVAYTRELRRLGVGVIFLSDAIDTRDADAELRLSIMGSIAQEESRRTSDRVKWGQTRQMERGVVFGRSLLGYTVDHGALCIEPRGAEIVRRIYREYVMEGRSSSAIAQELTEEQLPTARGGQVWSPGQIVRILKNEKYAGDLVQKKTYTPDYLTHQKKVNRGAEEKIVLRDHHTPIVERGLWDAAQEELSRRNCHKKRGGSRQYGLSGKIVCGVCGAPFVARNRYRKDGSVYRRWCCGSAVRGGCHVGMLLREDTAVELVRRALLSVPADREHITLAVGRAAGESDTQKNEERLLHRRDAAIEAFLAGIITKNDLQRLLERCRDMPREQKGFDWGRAEDILSMKVVNEGFLRCLVEQITVLGGGRAEVKLAKWPQSFLFQI